MGLRASIDDLIENGVVLAAAQPSVEPGTDAPVPKAMLACRDVDEGTCDYLQCLACKYERAIEEQRAPTCPPCDGPP